MKWRYKDRRRPDGRLKITPTQKKLDQQCKMTKMVKPFNYKTPEKGDTNGNSTDNS